MSCIQAQNVMILMHFKLSKQLLFTELCVKFHPTGKVCVRFFCFDFFFGWLFFQAELLGPEKWAC